MAGRVLPKELAVKLGVYIRQGRTARRLSLEDAADRAGVSIERIIAIESGDGPITDVEVQVCASRYGDVRAIEIDMLIRKWAYAEMHREEMTKRRKHLSIVGHDPKPWERGAFASSISCR